MAAGVRHTEEMVGAIAAAVEQQSVSVREIAATVAGVTAATEAAAGAMDEVATTAVEAETTSTEVRSAATGIAEETTTLGRELELFLKNLQDTADRRSYARIPGRDAAVRLALPGGASFTGHLVDISRGGLGVRLQWTAGDMRPVAGAAVTATLPGEGKPVGMRVVRVTGDTVALVAQQAPEVAAQMERAIAVVEGQALAA
jgi:hypothetical protein